MVIDDLRYQKLNDLMLKLKDMPESLKLALQAESEYLKKSIEIAQKSRSGAKSKKVSEVKDKLY
jgi:hypothetical protein